jgi:hypothetical protein
METIDLTPTWTALMPILLQLLQQDNLSKETRDMIYAELMHLAKFADQFYEQAKKQEVANA